MAQISIHRALTRLKLLDKQITESTLGTVFVAVARGTKDPVMVTRSQQGKKISTFEETAKSAFASITSKIDARKKLKDKIVASNAVTKVTIADTEMTVAAAIEMKGSIAYQQALLKILRKQFLESNSEFNNSQVSLDQEIQKQISILTANEKNARPSDEQYKMIAEMQEVRLKPILVDPLGAEEQIAALADTIESFLSEVDAVLSESNASTKIDVDE